MKRSIKNTTLMVLPALAAALGCSLFESSSSKKNDSIVPVVGGSAGATPDAGAGTGGVSAGGSGGAGGGGALGGAAGSSGAPTCLGLPGPSMVELSSPKGTKYCIDRTEVTQAHYAEFLAKTSAKPSTEHSDCTSNSTYEPLQKPGQGGFEPSWQCAKGYAWTPETTPNRPVSCVDWCDAYAYCAWAGKRLCGKAGGGSITPLPWKDMAPDPNDPAIDPNQSQWYNACSQGGKTEYPYGNTFNPLTCEGGAFVSQSDGGWSKLDVGSRAGCRGSSAPFNSILDLSGSLAEMTDECWWYSTPNGGGFYKCAARGGAFATDTMSCTVYAAVQGRTHADDWLGFRCCKDL